MASSMSSSPAFRTGPLTGEHRYLWVDATYHKVRIDGRVVSQATVVAVGVTSETSSPANAPARSNAVRAWSASSDATNAQPRLRYTRKSEGSNGTDSRASVNTRSLCPAATRMADACGVRRRPEFTSRAHTAQ